MLKGIIEVFLWTLIPALELRGSIPYGLFHADLPWFVVVITAFVSNLLLVPFLWLFLKYLLRFFLMIGFVKRIYDRTVIRTQKKLKPYVDKYGVMGLAFFIGIPLPGSGVYTGALGAYLLGFSFRHYLAASLIGVIIAATAVTAVCLTGSEALKALFIKT